jgi:hypothetical protein
MLNTSLHNPSVKQRMSLEDFTKMTLPLHVSEELIIVNFSWIIKNKGNKGNI